MTLHASQNQRRFLLVLLLLLTFTPKCIAATATANGDKGPLYVRVRLSTSFPVKLLPNSPATLLVDNKPMQVKAGQLVSISYASDGFLVQVGNGTWKGRWLALTPNEAPPATQPAKVHGATVNNGTIYRARLEALIYGGMPYLINVVPMNDYLYGVLGSEMPVSWPLESLKAQAVAARTYALYHVLYREPSDPTPWDVCDTQECQVYFGTRRESVTAYEAVRLTDREVLIYTGANLKYVNQLINAVFHSTSPGRTFNSEEVWTSPLPYLRSRDDSLYSSSSPWFEWKSNKSISVSTLANLLGMKQITTLAAKPGQYEPRSYTVTGGGVTRTVTKEQLRKWFGLPSPSFDLKTSDGKIVSQAIHPGDKLTTANGRGYGHGVGLSQYGAKAMADQGWSYTRILNFYYTDVSVRHYRVSGMRWPKGYPGM